jgi:receptor expression-enhancing protein 5/6
MDNKAKERAMRQDVFNKTKEFRQSQPELKRKKDFVEKYMPGDTFFVKLNKYLMEYKIINKICIKLKIDPIYIIIILLIPIIILLFMYFTFTTTMIALIYPLYMSFKTLQKKSFNAELDDAETTRWLSYWLIYAFINNTECIFWKFLEKIKIYNLVKFIFLILCFIPRVQLSVYIYNFITAKIFDKYGEKFEKNTVEFFRRMFGGKKTENNNLNNANNGELIDDDFGKFKKNE